MESININDMKITKIRKSIMNSSSHRQLDTDERLLLFVIKNDGFAGHLQIHFPTDYNFASLDARREFLLTICDRLL